MSRTRKTVLIKGDPCELRTAVEAADYALVETLLDSGEYDPNNPEYIADGSPTLESTDDRFIPLLHVAVIKGYMPIAELLLRGSGGGSGGVSGGVGISSGSNGNSSGGGGGSAGSGAGGHASCRADPNTPSLDNCNWMWTPLHVAANQNKHEMVLMLLEAGADPKVKIPGGHTPLHFAADKALPMVNALLEGGADPLIRTKAKVAAIHLTAQYGTDPAVLRLLAAYGACVGGTNFKGKTPVHYAIQRKSADMLEALLKLGAPIPTGRIDAVQDDDDGGVVNKEIGLTVWGLAERECRPESLKTLVRWGGNPLPVEDYTRLKRPHPQTGEWHTLFGVAAVTFPSWADGANDPAVIAARKEVALVRAAVDGCWSLSAHAMLQPRFDGILLTVLLAATVATASLGLPWLPTELWWEIFARCKVTELHRHATEFQVRRQQAINGGGGSCSGGGAVVTAAAATSFVSGNAANNTAVHDVSTVASTAAIAAASLSNPNLDDLFD